MKCTWKFVFSSIGEKIDLDYILKIHNEVIKDNALEWGVLIKGNIGISKTNYITPIPVKKQVECELQKNK